MKTSEQTKSGTIKLIVNNLEPGKGKIMVAIHNSEATFPDSEDTFMREQFPMKDDARQELIFEAIPYGDYAISVFQDVNDNDELDTGLFGIPKEPWGMSNNPKPLMRAPKYDECVFTIDQDQVELAINLR